MTNDDERNTPAPALPPPDKYSDLLWNPGQTPRASDGPPARGAARSMVRLVLVLDRSGSMYGHENRVRSAVSQFLENLDSQVPYLVTMLLFDHEIEQLATAEPIATLIAQAGLDCYYARGDTALWDAIARALEVESSRAEPVLCIVASDGDDNRSRLTAAATREMVDMRRGWGNWTFLWLNMTGNAWDGSLYRSPDADERLGIDCLDLKREDIVKVLVEIARKLSRAVRRMQLEGAKRIPDLLRLEAK
jgi:hypothetical protein